VQNAYIESFNGKFRDECLNEHWFVDLGDARAMIAGWCRSYNQERPHSSLGYETPAGGTTTTKTTTEVSGKQQNNDLTTPAGLS